MKKCQNCEKPLTGHPSKKYCDDDCRIEAYSASIEFKERQKRYKEKHKEKIKKK